MAGKRVPLRSAFDHLAAPAPAAPDPLRIRTPAPRRTVQLPQEVPKVERPPAEHHQVLEDLEPVTYRVTRAQRDALVQEAIRRRRRGKLDASLVLRELLDELLEGWLKRKRGG